MRVSGDCIDLVCVCVREYTGKRERFVICLVFFFLASRLGQAYIHYILVTSNQTPVTILIVVGLHVKKKTNK